MGASTAACHQHTPRGVVVGDETVQLTSAVIEDEVAWLTTNTRGEPMRGSFGAVSLSDPESPTILCEFVFNTTEYSDLVVLSGYAYVVGVTCYEQTRAILDVYDISDAEDPEHMVKVKSQVEVLV